MHFVEININNTNRLKYDLSQVKSGFRMCQKMGKLAADKEKSPQMTLS